MKNEFRGLKKNSQGQMAIEAILMMVVLLGGFTVLTKTIREKKLLSTFVAKPISSIAAMTAYGTWKDTGCTAPGKSAVSIGKCHPNSISRSLSSEPDPR